MAAAPHTLAHTLGRSCADCTLCCKLMAVDALGKPRPQWCEHCDIGKGCRIYADRPGECAAFYCGYMLHGEIAAHWQPRHSHMVLVAEIANNRMSIYVDDDSRDAWRQEPYISDIRKWVANAARESGQVIVWDGLNATALLPDREKNLGLVRDGQFVAITKRKTPAGVILDAIVMDKDDPRLQQFTKPESDPHG